MAAWGYGRFPISLSVAERKNAALAEIAAMRKAGRSPEPVVLEGTKIAATFWGKAWCTNLESYSDFASRLPRGRSYVRSGAVIHLEIGAGTVRALVQGTETYEMTLAIDPLAPSRWDAVSKACAGEITSLVELLQGRLSSGVMGVVTDPKRGIFPSPCQIHLECSCPDHATMCKHVAAALYGVGARLDTAPALLFLLRGVDPAQLVQKTVGRAVKRARGARTKVIADDQLAGIFGIELDEGPEEFS